MTNRGLLAALAAAAALANADAARAFCGFYVSGADAKLFNNATVVVMMRDGTRTVLSMQNNYQGPPSDFAMVVPVPVILQEENVKTLPHEIFDRVDQLAAPRLVEYWEDDPCRPIPKYDEREYMMVPSSAPPQEGGAGSGGDLGVKIEAQFKVAEYDIVILSAQDAAGLDTWLKREKYEIPDGAEPYLRPYVQNGSKFFVAKVDIEKVKVEDGRTMLSPLRFHYDSEKFDLPIRLGLINSSGAQDLIVHILARSRYETANYENVTIPTNILVGEITKEQFGPFYAALFDRTIEVSGSVSKGAVVTEYSWDAGSCDPCPSPPLDMSELATLGLDALPSFKDGVYSGGGFVLTRLHARYTRESLGEDLVFREARPIVGGRGTPDEKGQMGEKGATVQEGGYNNFQGRYIILHPWKGPVTCEEPRRGRWGGPPEKSGQGAAPAPKAARDTAFVERGKIELAGYVAQDVPEIGVKAVAVAATGTGAGTDTATSTKEKEKAKGCGCVVGGAQPGVLGGALLLLVALGALAGRRRR